jgi:hypothetical protein
VGSRPTRAEGFAFVLEDGSVFVDGSAYSCLHEGFAAAGAAAVQVGPDGGVIKAALAFAPRWLPQTSAAGEHLAAAIAGALAERPIAVVTGCAGVAASFSGGVRFACGYRRPFGGLWKDILAGATLADMRKTCDNINAAVYQRYTEAKSNEENEQKKEQG